MHRLERWQQSLVNRPRRRDVHRGREAVVRRLALVDVVVGVNRLLAAAIAGQDFVGPPGDHLIGVHVRLGARPGLPDDQRKLVVEIAARDLACRLLDDFGELRVEAADARVHPRRSLLDEAQRMNNLERHLLALAEREIPDRAFGLGAPIGVGGNLDRPKTVGFGAGGARHFFFVKSTETTFDPSSAVSGLGVSFSAASCSSGTASSASAWKVSANSTAGS